MTRIVCRNLAGAKHPGAAVNRSKEHQAQQWAFLASLGADVILAQEAVLFDGAPALPDGWTCFVPDHASDWVSVVAAAPGVDVDHAVRPRHAFLDALGSYVAAAQLRLDDVNVAVVSVHVPPTWQADHWAASGSSGDMPTGRHRPWPSDLLLDALTEVVGDAPAILAGDWNEAPRWPHEGDSGTAAFFTRAADAGWTEAVASTFGGEVRTRIAHGSAGHQNDHAFVTTALWPAVAACGVIGEPDRAGSDHAAIILDLRPSTS